MYNNTSFSIFCHSEGGIYLTIKRLLRQFASSGLHFTAFRSE